MIDVVLRPLRPGAEDERNLVLRAWLLSECHAPIGDWLAGEYFRRREPYLRNLVLPRSAVTLAVLTEDHDAIVGWMVSEARVPLHVGVKRRWGHVAKELRAMLLASLETS